MVIKMEYITGKDAKSRLDSIIKALQATKKSIKRGKLAFDIMLSLEQQQSYINELRGQLEERAYSAKSLL